MINKKSSSGNRSSAADTKKTNEQTKRLVKYLNEFSSGAPLQKTIQEKVAFYNEFLDILFNENPFSTVPPFGLKTLKLDKIKVVCESFNDGTLGQYSYADNAIIININFLDEICRKQKDIAELFNVVGHEYRHYAQSQMQQQLKNIDFSKCTPQEMARFHNILFSRKSQRLDSDCVRAILEEVLDSNSLNILNRNSEKIINEIVFCEYNLRDQELDAYQTGIRYAKNVITKMKKSISKQTGNLFDNSLTTLQQMHDNYLQSLENTKNSIFFQALMNYGKNLSLEELLLKKREAEKRIDDKLKTYEQNKNSASGVDLDVFAGELTFEMDKVSAYKFLIEKLTPKQSPEVLVSMLDDAINHADDASANFALKALSTNIEYAKSSLDDLAKAITEKLKSENLPDSVYKTEFFHVLSATEIQEINSSLIGKNKFQALSLFTQTLTDNYNNSFASRNEYATFVFAPTVKLIHDYLISLTKSKKQQVDLSDTLSLINEFLTILIKKVQAVTPNTLDQTTLNYIFICQQLITFLDNQQKTNNSSFSM